MGTYLHPGNSGFQRVSAKDYVDKTEMIGILNRTIGTMDNLTCVSRLRRFGKSFSAQMLCAYYDKSCDSHELFKGYKISNDPTYENHLNKYHVISIDVSGFIANAKKKRMPLNNIPTIIEAAILKEVQEAYPMRKGVQDLSDALLEMVRETGTKIVFVIDEWDSMIRETKEDHSAQETYLNMLKGWFKNNNFTPEAVAAAYMTGILPIKKDGSQSAISDFIEYSVLEPGEFAGFLGFTEEEVRQICIRKNQSFEHMKRWYDGYTFGEKKSIYNPYSVMRASSTGKYRSYWRQTAAADTLMTYIDMDQDGLQDDVARLITGEDIGIHTESFQNDVETFNCKDDVLTVLIHLGYLTYEEVPNSCDGGYEVAGLVRIPNKEVRSEFENGLRKATHKSLISLVRKSDKLLRDTLEGNEEAVVKAISDVHDSEYAPTFYNNEQSLRYVVKMAYISCVDQYAKVEELPSGRGMADVVFLPKRRSVLPAMIVELKWNRAAEGAIQQINDRKYPKALENYDGEIVLVGVSYDEKGKKHECRIVKHKK